MSFRCTLMILHISRVRRNVNRNAGRNVSATPLQTHSLTHRVSFRQADRVLDPHDEVEVLAHQLVRTLYPNVVAVRKLFPFRRTRDQLNVQQTHL